MKEVEPYPTYQILGISIHSSLSFRWRTESLTTVKENKWLLDLNVAIFGLKNYNLLAEKAYAKYNLSIFNHDL